MKYEKRRQKNWPQNVNNEYHYRYNNNCDVTYKGNLFVTVNVKVLLNILLPFFFHILQVNNNKTITS